jgi:hypothetical protein
MLAWLRERWKYGLTAQTRRRSRAFERQYGQQLAYEAELKALPVESARREALRLLAATALLRLTPADDAPRPRVAKLGPELRDFFSRYRRVETDNGGIHVDVAALADCAWRPGFVEIGACDGHVHLMARPGEDTVFEVADDVEAHRQVLATFPSIHHWVLALHFSEELAAAGDA